MSNTPKIKQTGNGGGRPGLQVQGRVGNDGEAYVAIVDPLAVTEIRMPLDVALGVSAGITQTVLALMEQVRKHARRHPLVLPPGS